jgi:hypothetical protein
MDFSPWVVSINAIASSVELPLRIYPCYLSVTKNYIRCDLITAYTMALSSFKRQDVRAVWFRVLDVGR